MVTKLKIIFIGSSGVGKTSILKRLQENSFTESYNPTREAGFIHYKLEDYLNKNWHFLIWDIGSQLKFERDLYRYSMGTNIIIFVYDVTNPVSIEEGYSWFVKFFSHKSKGVPVIFVGNKIDLPLPKVTDDDVKNLEQKIQALFATPIPTMHIKVSAKQNKGLDQIIQSILVLTKNPSTT